MPSFASRWPSSSRARPRSFVSDKTGTITQNVMTAVRLYADACSALASLAQRQIDGTICPFGTDRKRPPVTVGGLLT